MRFTLREDVVQAGRWRVFIAEAVEVTSAHLALVGGHEYVEVVAAGGATAAGFPLGDVPRPGGSVAGGEVLNG